MPAERERVHQIEFQPVGRHERCAAGESVLECARRLGIGISSVCGGAGTCGDCRIKVLAGKTSPVTGEERGFFTEPEIRDGWRLACQTFPLGAIKVEVPPESLSTPQRTQVEGLAVEASPEPAVRSYRLKLREPSLTDMASDSDRLLQALNDVTASPCDLIDYGVLRELSPRLRQLVWECQVAVRGREVISVGKSSSPETGFAVDLGSTKIAGYLVNLNDGRTLASRGVTNPQISYGDDIISRMSFAMASPEKARQMQRTVTDALNDMIGDLCAEASVARDNVLEAVVVGNTAMHHLFVGLPVEQLSRSPFVPAVGSAMDVKAAEIGISLARGAYVHLLPNVAGFVGADHVAALLAAKPWQFGGAVITIDIGTNTEVSLTRGDVITAVSCASGPAFEGGHITHGMRAARGAIEHVLIRDGKVQLQTIDNAPPAGICGSGILDAMAEMRRNGVVDESGRLNRRAGGVRAGAGGAPEFVLSEKPDGRDIVITQKDVRELQLAKAAIRTGIEALLAENGMTATAVTRIIIAGAFGTYINVGSAIEVGMLPPLPLARFRQVGNAAGAGARLALISMTQRREAQEIAARTRYLELASVPGFTRLLAETTHLGKYAIADGLRVAL